MPELPEVRVVIKALKEKILNKTIAELEILKPKLFKEKPIETFRQKLINSTIKNIENKGKYIIFHFNNDGVLISHLRMEGKYRFFEQKTKNHKHTMAKFIFNDGTELHYLDSRMFGTLYLRNNINWNATLPLSKLAPEPSQINIEDLYKEISKSTTAIKTKLLDQTLVAGLGNIYVDEALFASKIHPATKAKNIPITKLKEIIDNGAKIMEKSYQFGGTTIHSYESLNKQIGSYQNYLQIHSDKIKNCLICKNETTKIKINGRGTYLCSNCQKEY
ncbi:DNA-formamidopyrimidine glycosylase [Mycoplasma enhydrae]|uniref:DNA-formamidopyrimidine glycosylase n=1 Tax=Mycoplasma enhydrae TaxID=2499220 RepID=UPI00197BB952|nr:DNA-formamidopyrimidine glycosylase [Mycoplasma enhydrae]MBN4089342.1 DNA-formamidopyrimidine glycosylase [Mycoplasma enhydrae]MCV3733714.1 DNA-formamidopyrimidine glycosylase [Mycoplasma enhydrae]